MKLTVTQARDLRGWTPAELAEQSSLHLATIYRLEAGAIIDPSKSTVDALEAALSLKPGTLVFGPDAEVLAS